MLADRALQFGCQTRKLIELVVRVTIFHADCLSDLISSLFQCKVYGSDANAVADAIAHTGARVRQTPLRPAAVWKLINEKSA